MEVIEAAGLSIFLNNSSVQKGDSWQSPIPEGVWLGALLEGNLFVRQSSLGKESWRSGTSTLFVSRGEAEAEHTAIENGSVSAVFLHIDLNELESLLGDDAKNVMEHAVVSGRKICPVVASTIAWQMMGCPLSGAARKLYLTGKALEMMAHMLEASGTGDAHSHPGKIWSAREIESFHAARSILMSELNNPPSVPALARRVGTNPRKLGAGFGDLFGMPVYAFVKAKRFEAARLMLEAGETSISRVAQCFGYQPAHFSTEFRRMFGVSPTQLIARR